MSQDNSSSSQSESPQSAYSLENLFLEVKELPLNTVVEETKTDILANSGVQHEQEKLNQKTEPTETFLCAICYETYNKHLFFAVHCTCDNKLCRSCMRNHIEARLNYHFQTVSVNCPCCPAVIPDEKIAEYCSTDVVAKLHRFRLVSQARKDPDSIVYCPQVNCGCPAAKEEGQTALTCKKCSFSFCTKCFEHEHGELSCKQAFKKLPKEERKRKESIKRRALVAGAMSRVWATWKTKQCPSCKSFIEKNGGCHHMRCHYCNHNFCWNCGGNYNSRHCITRKVVLACAMPVTIPTAIALAPVTGVVSLGLMAGDILVRKKTGYRNGKYVDPTVVQAWRYGYDHFGKYFVEPFFD